MTLPQARKEVAGRIEDAVDSSWDKAIASVHKVGPLAAELMPALGDMGIDYAEVADSVLEDYSDLRKEYASRNLRPKAAPKAPSKKAPGPKSKAGCKTSKSTKPRTAPRKRNGGRH